MSCYGVRGMSVSCVASRRCVYALQFEIHETAGKCIQAGCAKVKSTEQVPISINTCIKVIPQGYRHFMHVLTYAGAVDLTLARLVCIGPANERTVSPCRLLQVVCRA